MAITRKLLNGGFTILDALGTVQAHSDEMVTDDVEGSESGRHKIWNAPAVRAAAEAYRDAIVAQAAQQGKPMTF